MDMKYAIRQKIYYRGDMANNPGWFEIVETYDNDYFKGYDLKESESDHSESRILKRIHECGISEIDKGNGQTRFVTEKAYQTFKNLQMEDFRNNFLKYGEETEQQAPDNVIQVDFCSRKVV